MKESLFLKALLHTRHQLTIERFGHTQLNPAWALRGRKVPEHYLTLIDDGEAVASAAGEEHSLLPGTLLWIQPGVAHSYRPADPGHPHTFYHLRFALLHGRRSLHLDSPVLYLRSTDTIHRSVEILYDEYHLNMDHGPLRFRALLTSLLIEILRHSTGTPTKTQPMLNPGQRRAIQAYIEPRLDRPIHARELAAEINLTPDYFSRLFRATYGAAPRSWLMLARMKRAAGMLTETPLTITEIARACGYTDIYTFSRLFKQCCGKSPRAYRKERD